MRVCLKPSRRGQATLEFAFVAPLFFLCLFGAIDAALWAVEMSAAVSGAEEAVRVAASALGTPAASRTPTSQDVFRDVHGRLAAAMFGTQLQAWPSPCPSSPNAVRAARGPRVVVVCAETLPPRYVRDPERVRVFVVGYAASLVPPSLGLGWSGGEIPILVAAETHVFTFTA